jgi:hypothetical protein
VPKRRRSEKLRQLVLIPVLAAVCLFGAGIGALVRNPSRPLSGRTHRDRLRPVIGLCGCYRAPAEIVTYTVHDVRYRIVAPLRCDPLHSSVLVSYQPDDPAGGRVIGNSPSPYVAVGAFVLGGGAIALET